MTRTEAIEKLVNQHRTALTLQQARERAYIAAHPEKRGLTVTEAFWNPATRTLDDMDGCLRGWAATFAAMPDPLLACYAEAQIT